MTTLTIPYSKSNKPVIDLGSMIDHAILKITVLSSSDSKLSFSNKSAHDTFSNASVASFTSVRDNSEDDIYSTL